MMSKAFKLNMIKSIEIFTKHRKCSHTITCTYKGFRNVAQNEISERKKNETNFIFFYYKIGNNSFPLFPYSFKIYSHKRKVTNKMESRIFKHKIYIAMILKIVLFLLLENVLPRKIKIVTLFFVYFFIFLI